MKWLLPCGWKIDKKQNNFMKFLSIARICKRNIAMTCSPSKITPLSCVESNNKQQSQKITCLWCVLTNFLPKKFWSRLHNMSRFVTQWSQKLPGNQGTVLFQDWFSRSFQFLKSTFCEKWAFFSCKCNRCCDHWYCQCIDTSFFQITLTLPFKLMYVH